MGGRSGAAGGTALTRISVLPFSVRGGPEVAYLGDGMVDLLSTKLDGAGNWRSADPRAILGVVDQLGDVRLDPDRGGEIAGRLEADLYVLGNIVEVGNAVQIDASLYQRGNDQAMVQASVEGASDEVLALVDDLAAQLLEGQVGQEGTRLTRLALVTTDSLAALKSYLTGVGEFRAARFPQAWDAFQDAVAADTAFALAWYQVSVTADWLLSSEYLPWEASERAMRFSSRLSDRDRQLLVAAHTSRLGETGQAERLYRSILGSYPDDVEAWLQLGELLFHIKPVHGGSIRESSEAWDRVLELEPEQPIAFVHQARVAAAAGDRVALESLTAEVLRLIPEGDRTVEMELLRALMQGDPDVTERVLDLLRAGSDDALSEAAWSATTFLQDLEAAEPVLRIMIEPTRSSEMQVLGHTLLAYQSLAQGRRIDALAALDRIQALSPVEALEHRANILLMPFAVTDSLTLELLREELLAVDPSTVAESHAPGIWVAVHNGTHHQIRRYLLGLVDANLGRTVEAFHEAGSLTNAPGPPGIGSAFADWSNSIRAISALVDGRTGDALAQAENLELTGWYVYMTPSPLLDRSRERWLLATLLEEAGRIDEALRWYGSFEDFSVYARVYEAPSHWRRARIYEARNELGLARQHYERFVELWTEVDGEFQPMVDAAQEWLEGFVEER